MKTFLNVVLILAVGVGVGLLVRSLRLRSLSDGPGPDAVVYTNDAADDARPITNDEPVRPPEDEAWLSRFELIERSGDKVTSEQLLGQPYVVSFFYSTCPSICVQQNQKIQQLQKEFADRGVRFVAISVDPETDTPEVLREYAARFGADKEQWLFLTGDLTYIRRVGSEVFQLPVNKQFHTERFVLVDAAGEIEGVYTWSEERQFEKLRKRIGEMLAGNGAKEA